MECFSEGFEYNQTRDLCVNSEEKQVTNPVLKCSKYKCLEKIYDLNLETELWEEK